MHGEPRYCLGFIVNAWGTIVMYGVLIIFDAWGTTVIYGGHS